MDYFFFCGPEERATETNSRVVDLTPMNKFLAVFLLLLLFFFSSFSRIGTIQTKDDLSVRRYAKPRID